MKTKTSAILHQQDVGGMFMTFPGPSKNSALNPLLLNFNPAEDPLIILNSMKLFWPILIVTDFWKGAGYGFIIYLGVIATIDLNLYETAEIDGGGRWVKMKYMTWPFLLETFVLLFILACGCITNKINSAVKKLHQELENLGKSKFIFCNYCKTAKFKIIIAKQRKKTYLYDEYMMTRLSECKNFYLAS